MANRNNYMNFVKHYDKIRKVLRQCYIVGLSSKTKEKSQRDYNNKIRRVRNFIDEEFLQYENINKTKYNRFYIENYTKAHNFLYDSYLIKNVDAEELKAYFLILQSLNQYDEIKNMNIADMKVYFAWKPVTYIYHNQIDARGDNPKTENEVFDACEEAVRELHNLIRRMTSANKTNFIITSDHGFLYRRRKLGESDKITFKEDSVESVGRRYLLSKSGITCAGTASIEIGTMMQASDSRMVTYPVGTDVFKVSGAGMNYVHGGCSLQEMMIPLITVKTDKSQVKFDTAKIALVSLTSKITNLITSLDFVQTEAVSSVVKETTYRIYFMNDKGDRISNEHLYVADKKDEDTVKRVFRLRFSFKNKKYSKDQKYYLVAYDDNNSLEVLRHEIVMDIAFADDFGF